MNELYLKSCSKSKMDCLKTCFLKVEQSKVIYEVRAIFVLISIIIIIGEKEKYVEEIEES